MSSKRLIQTLSRAAAAQTAPFLRSPASSLASRCKTSPIAIRSTLPRTIRYLSSSSYLRKEAPAVESELKPSTLYNFADMQEFSSAPEPKRIIIDVREPGELLETGTIPTSKNIPVTTSPDAFFLSPEEFEDKFGFERPGKDDEVVFFCKAGVRSKAAARLAQQAAFGGQTGEYPGSWKDWVESGGQVEKWKG
ncbi:uncharacterized protein HMPREF1541_00440 [Cyphellophora europaea CBS 101466]|uniref:Rhodanese domain-containing protein n=1 Tax=Cyphellophora europaea (strain CBS 101466) TaxID=1220924 RepID=W2SBZ9_CYPE1|nr:uncharacterized protein HMPREF1541_00440 [Cyphellophora europaea CBS 101466]ETN46256.1 hypothetical protein HMPREF1541_00440 [Cyphellophora europaea CBS 101466]